MTMLKLSQAGLLFVLIGLTAACSTNPVSGKQDFVMMSEEAEIKMGRESHASIIKQYGYYDDPELQAYVQKVGEKLAAKSHRSDLVYRFTVLDSTQINAFALPGGYIYITRGIMSYLNSEAELAAVLGHEIGHVTARHGVRQVSAAKAANLGYTIGSILVPELRSQAAQDLFNVLGSALISGYGREHELQSDRLGAEYLASSGYDPQAMIKVISVLKNQELFDKQLAEEEGREPRAYHGVFASHPANDQRLQEVVAAANKFKTPTTNTLARDAFLEQLEGLVFGDNEHEGIRRANNFYHAKMDFSLSFPEGWRIENTPNALVAQPKDRSAQIIMTVEDINKRISPREFISDRLNIEKLERGESLKVGDLEGYSGIATLNTRDSKRQGWVSVLYYHQQAYIFVMVSREKELKPEYDQAALATVKSFHALSAEERMLAKALKLRMVKNEAGLDFKELARQSAIPHHAEDQLRLLNDYYPEGEPKAGQKIKIVK